MERSRPESLRQLRRPALTEIERIVNEPSVRPTILPPGGYIDMSAYYERPGNEAVVCGKGMMLFPCVEEGIFESHFLFPSEQRGKAALEAARTMLNYMFLLGGARVIMGYPSRDNRAVQTFGTRLGYRRTGRTRPYFGAETIEYELLPQRLRR